MKLLLTGTPVSPSRAIDGFLACVERATAVSEPAPYAGLVRTRAYAAVPSVGAAGGPVSPSGVVSVRPLGGSQPMRQHIDLDPQRPRPLGGCH